MIPYGRQSVGEEEKRAVAAALASDYLTTGPRVEAFEEAMARYCGARHAVAVSNGTAALHTAVSVLDLGPGDEGITSANTFLASANCMPYCGMTPKFADIEAETYCIDPEDLYRKTNFRTRLVIPVHFAGHPCDMEAIWNFAQRENLFVIEDAAHALGTSWEDRSGVRHRVGACSHSHLTIFSFHPVKTITAGEGGMILTNDDGLAEKCRRFRNHGMMRNPEEFQGISSYCSAKGETGSFPWYYEMQTLGYNYRLTDIQAALGLVQLGRISEFIEARRRLWKIYTDAFRDIGDLTVPIEKDGVTSCWHLYVLQTAQRNELLGHLHKNGVYAHAMYIPVHLQPYYRNRFGYRQGDFPGAEDYFNQALILPLFPALKEEEQAFVIETVNRFFRHS